jgi:hypothetical protein
VEETRSFKEQQYTHGQLAAAGVGSSEGNVGSIGNTLGSSILATNYQKKHEEFLPTDCHNFAFEASLKGRPQHRVNHLAEHRKKRKEAWLQMLHRRHERMKVMTQTISRILGTDVKTLLRQSGVGGKGDEGDADDASQGSNSQTSKAGRGDDEEVDYNQIQFPKIHLYSIQSENYKTKAWKELRHRIAEDHHATYTLSKDFMSQTISPIDEAEERMKSIEMEKSCRLTQKGFQYPKPKTRKELIEHPKCPSDARIEELKEPFTDLLDRKANDGITSDPVSLERERKFASQVRPEALFGALELPEYEYEFQLKHIGDREKLPRGTLVKGSEKNPGYFRSVHLGGENQRKIIEEAQAQEKEEWANKVVVDTHDFKVGGFRVRDKPIVVNRCQDILKGDAKTPALQTLRDRKSHQGKDWSYQTTPLTIMNAEEFVPAAHREKTLMRSHDQTKFITAKIGETHVSGQPKDFTRYINEYVDKPKMISMIAKKKHPPLDRSQDPVEYSGPRWDPPTV